MLKKFMTIPLSSRCELGLVAVTLAAAVSLPNAASADQWVAPVTPTPTQVINGNAGGMYIEIVTAEAVANPANCPNADGYVVNGPALVNSAAAIALAALMAGHQIRIYVVSSSCDPQTTRPLATIVGSY
jgi:hypothetical protein